MRRADRARRARTGVACVFAANGFVFAAWASRIPAIRDDFRLTADRLGLVLLAISVGSMLAMPMSGAIIHRIGARRTVLVAGPVACAAVALVGLSSSIGALALGFAVFGACSGTWDVAMNVEGTQVERRLGRDIMSRFHAAWSLGSVAGAGVGALAAGQSVPIRLHLPAVALLGAVAVVLAGRTFLGPAPAGSTDRSTAGSTDRPTAGSTVQGQSSQGSCSGRSGTWTAWTERRTLALGVMVLCLTLAEGSANDWLALGVVDDYGTGQALGAAGYAVFVTAMLTGRLVGPVLLGRFGRVPVLRGSALLAVSGISGYALGARLDGIVGLGAAAAGVVCWGFGSSLGFPVGLSAAADDPKRAAARVSAVATLGYLAFLAGPPLLGRLAANVGVVNALTAVTLPVLVAFLVAGAAGPPPGSPSRGGSRGSTAASG